MSYKIIINISNSIYVICNNFKITVNDVFRQFLLFVTSIEFHWILHWCKQQQENHTSAQVRPKRVHHIQPRSTMWSEVSQRGLLIGRLRWAGSCSLWDHKLPAVGKTQTVERFSLSFVQMFHSVFFSQLLFFANLGCVTLAP